MLAILDQSLKRLGLDYVDIFYFHRFDPDAALEQTMGALLGAMEVRCLIHQPSYSILNRWIERGLLEALKEEGLGCIAFAPLARGLRDPRVTFWAGSSRAG